MSRETTLPTGLPHGVEPGFHTAVLRPTAEANGLPNAAYTSEAFLTFERDHLLAKTWTAIGSGAEIPRPGDAKPVDLLGLPLLLLRDQDHGIRVFHNVCSHRGMQLVSAPCNVGKVIRCPYHSWVYSQQGDLRVAPLIGGPGRNDCPGFDKGRHGLKPVRSAVWFDQVFVNLSGDAPPFEDYIAPLAERWMDFDGSLLRHGGADSSLQFELDCNWKLAVENYCEAYHLPWVHPGLNSYSRIEDHYNIELEDRFAGQGTTVYAPNLPGPDFPRFPDLPAVWDKQAEYIALFPNILLGIHNDHIFALRLEPLAPGRTREQVDIYYVGEAPLGDAYSERRRANAEAWRSVFQEDVGVVEGMQRGRASPAFAGGVFSPVMDTPTHCFHRWVAASLGAVLETGGARLRVAG